MKRLLFASFVLFAPVRAWAEQAPPPPNVQALSQTVLKLTDEALTWQTQAIALQTQLDDAKAAAEAATKDAQAKPQEPRP